MKCSIIIRCLNEEHHLPRLLDGIDGQTMRPFEVIIVDSGSKDLTVQIARSRGARIEHIEPGEFSFGRALNLGARVAGGDVLVMASAHTYPASERWLELLLKPFSDSAVALVYGAQRGDHRSKFSELQLFKQWFPSAAIVHVHEEGYAKIYNRYRREGMGLRMILPWEQMSFMQALTLAASAIRSDLRQARLEGVLCQKLFSILSFRAAQYWGTYRGLHWRGTLTNDLRAHLYYPKGYRDNSRRKFRQLRKLISGIGGICG